MQKERVRIGLTGLAVVFLLVVLAAAVVGVTGREALPVNQAINVTGEAPKEPLAELGVVPGNAPDTSDNSQTPPGN
jgi:hypothetical protein